MVIVHRNQIGGCPTGGWDDPTQTIEVVTEYLPRDEIFQIKLPDYMHERLNGATVATGKTARDCHEAMLHAWDRYRNTFMEAREVRKYLCFTNDVRVGTCQGILAREIRIKFSWNIIYLCQMNSDKPDEQGWVRCSEDGRVSNSRDLRCRVFPEKRSYDDENYLEWTPEREVFFTELIGQFNAVKRKMMDFFDPRGRDEMVTKIDSASGMLLLTEQSQMVEE